MDITELIMLAKQSLSIVSSATAKDFEIKMWIEAGIKDLERQGINPNLNNTLIKATIIMFVKSNFGMVDINEKKQSIETYNSLCKNLGLSTDFKEVENA